MYYSITLLTPEEFNAIGVLRPWRPQMSHIQAYRPSELPYIEGLPKLRLIDATWSLLSVHEVTDPELRYEFIVSLLCSYYNGLTVVWRIHFNQRIPLICIGRLESIDPFTEIPCSLIRLEQRLFPEDTQPLHGYLNSLQSRVYYVNDN